MYLGKLRHHELHAILAELEQALQHHTEWHNNVIRALICKLNSEHTYCHSKSHEECLFGQWYYGKISEKLKDHPGVLAVGETHKIVHLLAQNLLQTVDLALKIDPRDYENFAMTIKRMQLEIASLKREIEMEVFTHDPLTGAINRIDMLPILRELHEISKRYSHTACIVMADIQGLSNINEKFGFDAGDAVLQEVVSYLRAHIRPFDKVFRYSGDKFLFILQHIAINQCFDAVDRIRTGLEALAVKVNAPELLHIQTSFGVAILDPEISVEQCIDHAEKSVLAAKSSGQRCTKMWDNAL